jgi:hypothetical protein
MAGQKIVNVIDFWTGFTVPATALLLRDHPSNPSLCLHELDLLLEAWGAVLECAESRSMRCMSAAAMELGIEDGVALFKHDVPRRVGEETANDGPDSQFER